jgi:hypothetical protein
VADEQPLDPLRLVEVFDRFGVEYLLVGGIAAQLHGASRPTTDFDSLPSTKTENLRRLAGAMRELNARLRVEGVSDDEARHLPVPLDEAFLASMDLSTWRTDAGDLDILTALPTSGGGRASYDQLVGRADRAKVGEIVVSVVSLPDLIESKEWADRPKDRAALSELRELDASSAEPTPLEQLRQSLAERDALPQPAEPSLDPVRDPDRDVGYEP